MTGATVLAARRPIAVQLGAILRDWGSLGLISPVVVVDVDSARGNEQPATTIDGATVRPELLTDSLARGVVDVVRVCVVSVVDSDDDVAGRADCTRMQSAVIGAVPQARLVPVALFAGSGSDDWAARMQPPMGWHNFALSPEDAASPSGGGAALTRSSDDARWLTALVGSLCSLLGLWVGQARSVLDDRSAPSGDLVVPLRIFSRSLSAEGVDEAVLRSLLDVGQRYPVPRVNLASAVVVDDEAATALGMADALMVKHQDVLPRPRSVPPPPPRQLLDFKTALRMFLRFMLDAIRNAPRRIAEELWYRSRATMANAVQHVVFGGGDSSFTVVVRGVRADGSAASWAEFESGLDSVISRSTAGAELTAPPQKPQLWLDFVDGGMTLLDGGTRCQELPPRTMGTQVAVVTTTQRVAPAQGDRFVLPDHLSPWLPNWEVEPGDDIAGGRLFGALDILGRTQTHLATQIAAEKQRLRDWSARHTNSYVGRVGRRLGDGFRATVAEVEGLNERIARLQEQADLPDDVAKSQDALAKRMRILAVIGLLGLVAGILLIVFDVLALITGLIVLVGFLIVWFLSGALVYLKGQQLLYQLLNRRTQLDTDLETARRHRAEALEDLRRLSRAYRQFLDWSRAFGSFVQAPLGQPPACSPQKLLVGQGLPRSIGLGMALPDADAVDEVCNRWRLQLFHAGWLSDCWTEFLKTVPASLGQQRYAVQSDPGVLLTDPNPDGQGPILTRWSAAVARDAAERAASVGFLQGVGQLSLTDEQARERLLNRIAVRDSTTGQVAIGSRQDFVQGLDREYEGTLFTFSDAMFSPLAATAGVREVRQTQLFREFNGLAMATVVVQTGGAYPPSEYRAVAPSTAFEADETHPSAPSTIDFI